MAKFKNISEVSRASRETIGERIQAEQLTDEEIVATYLSNPSAPDRDIEEELCKRLCNGLHKGISSLLPSIEKDELDDIASDGMVCVFQRLYTWSSYGKLFNWCYTIGRNKAIDHKRKMQSDKLHNAKSINTAITSDDEKLDDLSEELIRSFDPDGEQQLLANEFLEKWRQFIKNIPLPARDIIVGIMKGKFTSISNASIFFRIYPYEVRNIISPYKAQLRELLEQDAAIWTAVRSSVGWVWE